MSEHTFESLLNDIEEGVEDGFGFECTYEEARALLEGIRDLQRNYDRASRYQYPDRTGG